MSKENDKKEQGSKQYNPYLAARREWNERYGTYIKEKKMWQTVAIASMVTVAICVMWIGNIGSQSKKQPYIVEVDKLGRAVASGPARPIKMPNELVIKAQLARFVRNLRAVTSDAQVQKDWLFEAYAMVNQADPSAKMITDYYGGGQGPNSPFTRASSELVNIEISTVLPQSKDSWEVEWVETIRDRKGVVTGKLHMRALLQTYYAQQDTLKGVYTNPAGVYVKSFSWSKQV